MYSTISVSEAAYLVAKGHNVQSLAAQRNSRMIAFLFEPAAAKDAPGFYSNAPIAVYDFHLALQSCRKMVRRSNND